MQVNVFVLGAVYLQLLQVLRLQNHASFARCDRLQRSRCTMPAPPPPPTRALQHEPDQAPSTAPHLTAAVVAAAAPPPAPIPGATALSGGPSVTPIAVVWLQNIIHIVESAASPGRRGGGGGRGMGGI